MENISKILNSFQKQVTFLSTIRTLNKIPNLRKHFQGVNQLEQGGQI
jgi:hypothetical protein